MAEMFSVSVDSAGAIAMFDRLGQSADFVCREVALDTAKRIVAEMQRRIARGKYATGETAGGIHFELSYRGDGYVVLMGDVVGATETTRRQKLGMKSARSKLYGMKHTGIWLEFGTPNMRARKFFFSSAELEAGPYLRRLETRIQSWLDSVGR